LLQMGEVLSRLRLPHAGDYLAHCVVQPRRYPWCRSPHYA
jgi:hypothetical protein